MSLLGPLMLALVLAPSGFQAKQEALLKQTDAPAGTPQILLDINQASAEDFAKLPGIGPKLAARIVAFRQKHGPFRRVEDLLAIRGIGHKKWKAIRPYLRVESAERRK
jgi:competence ComEA-like helix-hairpin-helix protein